MCAALDELGAVAPWQEYMHAFAKEADDDNTIPGEHSDRAVAIAWLRGRLRLASLSPEAGPSGSWTQVGQHNDARRDLYARPNSPQLASAKRYSRRWVCQPCLSSSRNLPGPVRSISPSRN